MAALEVTTTLEYDLVVFEVVVSFAQFSALYQVVDDLQAACLRDLQRLQQVAEEVVVLIAGEVHLADDGVGLADVLLQNLLNVLRDMIFVEHIEQLAAGLLELLCELCFACP